MGCQMRICVSLEPSISTMIGSAMSLLVYNMLESGSCSRFYGVVYDVHFRAERFLHLRILIAKPCIECCRSSSETLA